MGAGAATVLGVFVVQGMVAGVAGTLVGAVLGVVLGHHITAISQTLETWLNALPLGGESICWRICRPGSRWGRSR